jgi:hypothetical protein
MGSGVGLGAVGEVLPHATARESIAVAHTV